jgi:hypothetical protein
LKIAELEEAAKAGHSRELEARRLAKAEAEADAKAEAEADATRRSHADEIAELRYANPTYTI